MKTVALALALSTASAFVPTQTPAVARSTETDFSKADLADLAVQCNPVVKYWDPLGLSNEEFYGDSNEATIGFLRHAEIKHGRVAMMAFVGYCVQANGFHWPWPMSTKMAAWPTGTPPEQWDALPVAAKWQIMFAVAFFEFWSEVAQAPHYMRGGKPGEFPSFKNSELKIPHPVPLDLFDPFGFSSKKSAEAKASGLVKEINNGRLAMIGIFGFLAESKVPGSVPALAGKIPPYSGDYMIPFEGNFHYEGITLSM